MKSVLKPLASSILISLELTAAAAAPATDSVIQEKTFRSSIITQIISNQVMDNIMKIVKSLEESGLLIKGVTETI